MHLQSKFLLMFFFFLGALLISAPLQAEKHIRFFSCPVLAIMVEAEVMFMYV